MFNKRCLILAALLFLGNASDLVGGEVIQQQISVSSVLSDIATSLNNLVRLQATKMRPSTMGTIVKGCGVVATGVGMAYMIFQILNQKALLKLQQKEHIDFKAKIEEQKAPVTNLETYAGNINLLQELRTTIDEKQTAQQEINDDIGIIREGSFFLIEGVPGTGKSLLAKTAIEYAKNKNIPTLTFSADDLKTSLIAQTAKNITAAFQSFDGKLGVIFIDEAEGLFTDRSTTSGQNAQYQNDITNAFLVALTNFPNVIFIATTNNSADIDPAMRRSGRCKIFQVLPPQTQKERLDILQKMLEGRKATINDVTALERAAEITKHCTHSDLGEIIGETQKYSRRAGHNQLQAQILIAKAHIMENSKLQEALNGSQTADNRQQHIDPQIMNLLLKKMFPSSVGNPVAPSTAKPITRSTSAPEKLDSLTKKRSTAPAEGGASKHD